MKPNNLYLIGLLTFVMLLYGSCTEEEWDNHYVEKDKKVNLKLKNAITEEYQVFMELISQYGLDSLITSNHSKTLFIPNNEAFQNISPEDTAGVMKQLLNYHVSPSLFQVNNIPGETQLYTSSGKFVRIMRGAEGYLFDSIKIDSTSPLYLDGKFYELSRVAIPRPNIYEYMELYSPFLRNYINSKDTIFLDKNKSTPVGYNDEGQTVYDSVYTEQNIFELNFFPVTQEFRNRRATFIIFTQEQYNGAIQEMAGNMGIDKSDIPLKWQNEVFLPDIMKKSIYEGQLEYNDFNDTLINIRGDSTFIDPGNIDPSSRFTCSNGLIYNYLDFKVPEELYSRQLRFEGENFCDSLGLSRFIWQEELVAVNSDIATEPIVGLVKGASNDSIVTLNLKRNYDQEYSVEFTIDNMFPRDYLLKWHANTRPSGCFKVYVNGVDVTSTNPLARAGCFDLFSLRGAVPSPVPGERPNVPDERGYNTVGFLVEDILTDYGEIKIKLEYIQSGMQSNNGFSIDYFALTPLDN